MRGPTVWSVRRSQRDQNAERRGQRCVSLPICACLSCCPEATFSSLLFGSRHVSASVRDRDCASVRVNGANDLNNGPVTASHRFTSIMENGVSPRACAMPESERVLSNCVDRGGAELSSETVVW